MESKRRQGDKEGKVKKVEEKRKEVKEEMRQEKERKWKEEERSFASVSFSSATEKNIVSTAQMKSTVFGVSFNWNRR